MLTPKAGSDPKAHEPDLTRRGIHQNIGRLHILVNHLSFVQTAERRCETDSEAQKLRHLHRARNEIHREFRRRDLQATSVICALRSERSRGRTAQAGSSSLLSEYSWSIFLRVSGLGRVEAGRKQQNGGELYLLRVGPVKNEFSIITKAGEGVLGKLQNDPRTTSS